ncbi:hypothetical protein FRC11_013553, partial [Ceratobasidium sp. 423]
MEDKEGDEENKEVEDEDEEGAMEESNDGGLSEEIGKKTSKVTSKPDTDERQGQSEDDWVAVNQEKVDEEMWEWSPVYAGCCGTRGTTEVTAEAQSDSDEGWHPALWP